MFLKKWAYTLLILFAPIGKGSVLIQAPGVSSFDYQTQLKADPDLMSPTQILLRQRPSNTNKNSLIQAFISAQKIFIANPADSSGFEKIVDMTGLDDWSPEERKVLLHSYLRIAQIQGDSEERKKWLFRSLNLGDDLEPQADLFPPPLLREYHHLREEVPRASIPPEIFEAGWSVVTLNGKLCSRRGCSGFPLTGDKIRVTYLSDVWQPATLFLEGRELSLTSPRRVAWVSGDCRNPQITSAVGIFNNPKFFFGSVCSAKPQLAPIQAQTSLPNPETKEPSPSFYKSKWFWAGVSAVGIALLISSQTKRESKEPSTTYGHR